MSYTTYQLAKMSGVSVRTLHWYDEIDLLKPAMQGNNKYRYYEKEQLLLLQQILFFRELGMTLMQIKGMITNADFDKVTALEKHWDHLNSTVLRCSALMKTVERTIADIRGKLPIADELLYQGFYEWAKNQDPNGYAIVKYQKKNESILKVDGNVVLELDTSLVLENAEEVVLKSTRNVQNELWTIEDYQKISDRGNLIFSHLKVEMEKGAKINEPNVQSLIKEHYTCSNQFYRLTEKVYLALAELYETHPAFKKQLDLHHIHLPTFMREAMEYFVETIDGH